MRKPPTIGPQIARDQQTLTADLDRRELELVTRILAAIVAEIAHQAAKEAGWQSAERVLDRMVRRFAAEAAKNPPGIGEQGSGE